ncbi:MAG TPA: response regulator transcription factor [Opitutaceae bacterium]|nr:response regulator transcription factor [Opitutaceae bacterium]
MKIVIVEDHQMFRDVVHKVCTSELHHTVVGEASDGMMAVDVVARSFPDLVILDVHLPNLDGFGVVDAIRQAVPLVKILVLSSHCDDYTVFRAERAHVQGFVDKNTNSVETVKAAIRAIGQGKTYFSDTFVRVKAARLKNPQSFDKLLTDRERSILSMIGEPLNDAEIADRLKISIETAEKHRFNILKKLGLASTAELGRYARDHGFTLSGKSTDGGALLP